MAFWKKSEDPWDVDPARARAKREPIETPLDTLRDWNEERKAKAAEKQAELEAQPKEVCPWCGREMERGCLQGCGRPQRPGGVPEPLRRASRWTTRAIF